MKPYYHAKNSVNKYGGKIEDYQALHNEMDSSKSAHATMAHRLVFHSAFGIYIMERIFGETITNSDGVKVCVRDIAEDHVLEDLHFIPSLDHWLKNLKLQDWMTGSRQMAKPDKFIKID
jgi:hypothetical protein